MTTSSTAWHKPSPRIVWKAVQAYLALAYDGAADPAGMPTNTPSAVRSRLETLRSTPDDAFYDSPVFEHPASTEPAAAPAAPKDPREPPVNYALRLGNRDYPHMKLIIDRAPDGGGYLLRADTHDAHVQPRPGSRDYAAFQELARANHALAEAIEQAWEGMGLPTFKKFLRDDLERRPAGTGKPSSAPRPPASPRG